MIMLGGAIAVTLCRCPSMARRPSDQVRDLAKERLGVSIDGNVYLVYAAAGSGPSAWRPPDRGSIAHGGA